MDILDLAAAVFIGNCLTAAFVWAVIQFNKHDENAPWFVYAAFIFPVLFALVSLYLTGLTPPHLDAIASK